MGYTPEKYLNRYPIYVISKSRWETPYTIRALENLGIPFYVAVEQHQVEEYKKVVKNPECVLTLPWSNHGKGSGPARNWCWEHSISLGAKRHWILDDNIREFWRRQKNKRYRVETGSFFRACEDFVDRYQNVTLAGLQYKFFVMDKEFYPPFILNTRMMSCILIENSCKHRWRAKYNEDVDLSLRVLKDGDCTILFYNFLQGKLKTGTVKGGNTTEIYGNGTFEKSQMLCQLHPDCVRMTFRYGRWHHEVDLSNFRNNELIPIEGLEIPSEPNDYGMKFVDNYVHEKTRIK